MDPRDRFRKLEEVFNEALEKPSDERRTYVRERCAGDEAMTRDVFALLDADATREVHVVSRAADAFLHAWDVSTAGEHPAEIGPYRIDGVLGDGGMGVVYRAEQREPVRRSVALKVIKPGMDSRAVVARFEAERQALALMQHPAIARIFDAGLSERGTPFFAMELVEGTPITAYCDEHRLGLRERLALFIDVCAAVQHAHTKGVIHRDLKPSNILVTHADGRAVPKVIDFGVAKALDHELTQETLFTRDGQFVGTPEYMSPEQAAGSVRDIDTRTDVYALGVLLYELLTGECPFSSSELRHAGFAEIQRIIRETEPQKPSTRLGSMASSTEHAARVAGRRRTELRTLTAHLRRDLDWVVMRCIEKERERRYDTPSALAEDLERYLRSEPVIAGPPSASYRVSKFARRHRGPLATATIIALLLVVGSVVSATGWARALDGQREARAALVELVRNGLREQWGDVDFASRVEAAGLKMDVEEVAGERRFLIDFSSGQEIPMLASYAEQIYLWLEETRGRESVARTNADTLASYLEELLTDTDPLQRDRPDRTLRDVLDEASVSIDERLADTPVAAARMHRIIGQSYFTLDELERAEFHFDRAESIAREHEVSPTLLAARVGRAELMRRTARESQAKAALLDAIEGYRTIGDTLGQAGALVFLSDAQRSLGEYDGAIDAATQAIELVEPAADIRGLEVLSRAHAARAYAHRFGSDWDQAIPDAERAVELAREAYGNAHVRVTGPLSILAEVVRNSGDPERAVPHYEESLQIRLEALGPESASVGHGYGGLGSLLVSLGRYKEAIERFETARQIHTAALGPGDRYVGHDCNNMARAYARAGQHEQAVPLFDQAAEIYRGISETDPNRATTLSNSVASRLAIGDIDAAEHAAETSLAIRKKILPEGHPSIGTSYEQRADVRIDQGRFEEAADDLEQALTHFWTRIGRDHPRSVAAIERFRFVCAPDRLNQLERVDTFLVRHTPREE